MHKAHLTLLHETVEGIQIPMNTVAFQHAAMVLQISLKGSLSSDDIERLKKYLSAHYQLVVSADDLVGEWSLRSVREISAPIPGVNMKCDDWAEKFQEALGIRKFISLFIYITPRNATPILYDSTRKEIGHDTHFATLIKIKAVGWYVFDNLNPPGVPLVNFIPEIKFELDGTPVADRNVKIVLQKAATLREAGNANPRSLVRVASVKCTLATLMASVAEWN